MEGNKRKSGIKRFPHIFQPSKIGRYTTRNSAKWAACSVSNMNNGDGSISERELARDAQIARSGFGILTNQGAYVDAKGEGKAYHRQIAIYDGKFLPQFEKIAQMYHEVYPGTVAIQQLLHCGRYGGIDLNYCVQPSAVPQTLKHFRPPREMTKEDIKECIREHVAAARRAVKAGFDGVELTSFMGYLLANFASKFTNQRTDEYGGSPQNRARFACELCQAIKEAIGDDHVLSMRLCVVELMEEYGGNTVDECLEIIQIVAEASKLDLISLVVGWHESRRSSIGRDVPVDGWVDYVRRAKRLVGDIPIAYGIRMSDPEVVERCLRNGDFDFWEVCRPGLADPDFLHKIEEDGLEDIRPCLGGNTCLSRSLLNLPYQCTVNPRMGHEMEPEYQMTPAVRKKNVTIIGGGPAGTECAIRAAKRGHKVILFEKSDRLGGQINLATKEPSGGREFRLLVKYYEKQLSKLGVDVKLNSEGSRQQLAKIAVEMRDVAVIATGSSIKMPPWLSGDTELKMVTAFEVLKDGIKIENPVVVIGGDKASLVTAFYLARQKFKVTVIAEQRRPAEDVGAAWKWRYFAWLAEEGIPFVGSCQIIRVDSKGVVTRNDVGKEDVVTASTIVYGVREPEKGLWREIEYMFDELYVIGDAVEPRSIYHAIHEGFRLGVRI